MSTTLKTTLKVELAATLKKTADLVTSESPLALQIAYTLANGSGLNQASKIWSDTRTIAADLGEEPEAQSEELDLSGVLTDEFGTSILFTKIKALIIRAAAGNTNDVVVGGADAAQFAAFLGDVDQTVIIRPGGCLILVAADATAYPVTAATADKLKVANSDTETPVTYDIVVIGA